LTENEVIRRRKSDEKEEREDKFRSVVAGSRKMTGLYRSSTYLNNGCDRENTLVF
jgi:hypothetical protein